MEKADFDFRETQVGWAPSSREGHSACYSQTLRGAVLFGGYAPGREHLSDCCICRIFV